MRHFYAGMLALACVGAQASTYELWLTNPSLSVVDITPDDQFAPSYTVDTGNVADLLTPSYTSAKGIIFEDNTVLPPSTGPESSYISGMLGPGTELIWAFTYRLKSSVIDTDGRWDEDRIHSHAIFYSADWTSNQTGLEYYLAGSGGTYQRITQDDTYETTVRATNPLEVPRYFKIGWVTQYEFYSESTPRPVSSVPEPETYALLLAGLGVVGAIARRRRTT